MSFAFRHAFYTAEVGIINRPKVLKRLRGKEDEYAVVGLHAPIRAESIPPGFRLPPE